MGNWKCYLIGPIESDFRKDIDDFFINNPHLKKSVIFTDAINDKKELWEYYNRSKIFIFASMFESYCLAFNEAKRFGNYIITTNVGAAGDIIQNEEFGEFVEQDDDVTMAKKIQNVIDGKTDISHVYDRFDISSLSWNSVLKEVANRLK
jgi:glycosyltransferase involved in cell wall biosynthesis